MSRSIRKVNCVVTGGAGFLGSQMVDYLIEERNCDVLVIDNLSSGRREFIHPRAKFEHHDITGSENHLYKILSQFNTDYVFQYSAHPYIPVSFERPLYVADTNAMGALKVINAAHEAGVTGILQISSAEIYGNATEANTENGIDENFPVAPHSTYGASKAFIDSLVQVRWREAQVPCIALRQFNCVGPRDFMHPYIIPEIIRQVYQGSRTIRLGNNSFRDFMYSGDQVRIAVELLEKGEWGHCYNLGSEEGIQIYDLAVLIGNIMGRDITVVQEPSRIRPFEIWKLLSNNSKIKALGISQLNNLTSLQESLRLTIKSFSDNGWEFLW